MPVYDYLCEACGAFTLTRPMAEYDAPAPCPDCGGETPRAMLTAPYFSATAVDPGSTRASDTAAGHTAGCSCCAGFGPRMSRRGQAVTKKST